MNNSNSGPLAFSCPLPIRQNERIVMGHGSGGKMTHDLIKSLFWKYFRSEMITSGNDAAVINSFQLRRTDRIAICTDSHVVSPLFFPGGDIGRLAVCGTVNDLAMMGADPLWLTAGFILEEGLELKTLEQILYSMQKAAEEAGVEIIAGDTKVVQRGKGDGIYINTSGYGIVRQPINISCNNAKPGDLVILSGTIGDHGIAVLMARGELGFEAEIQSDVAPLNHMVAELCKVCTQIHVLRDPTRGGLATTLNEIATSSNVCIYLEEVKIPIQTTVSAACEVLGFDPLYIANEGKLVAIVHPSEADKVLSIMRKTQIGAQASIIGEVKSSPERKVLLRTSIRTTRVLEMLSGEMLPRIC